MGDHDVGQRQIESAGVSSIATANVATTLGLLPPGIPGKARGVVRQVATQGRRRLGAGPVQCRVACRRAQIIGMGIDAGKGHAAARHAIEWQGKTPIGLRHGTGQRADQARRDPSSEPPLVAW